MMIDACTCCCKVFGILVANSNGAKDDNFSVKLNGTEIGTIDNSLNDFTGRAWCLPADVADFNKDDFVRWLPASPNHYEETLALDESLLIQGVNTLRIVSTNNAANGNFGTVQIGGFNKETNDVWLLAAVDGLLIVPPAIVPNEARYSGVSGALDTEFTFYYPARP